MIKSFTFLPLGRSRDDIFFRKLFKLSVNPRKFEFTNGLNIIIGPNGCGKTTLIDSIAKRMSIDKEFYQQDLNPFSFNFDKTDKETDYSDVLSKLYLKGGYTVPTEINFSNALCYRLNSETFNINKMLDNVMFGDGSLNKFESFGHLLAAKIHNASYSHGEQTNLRFQRILNELDINWEPNERFKNNFKVWFESNKSSEKPTLLLDEIDDGLDLPTQLFIWNTFIPILLKTFQVIIISHSILSIIQKNANYISFYGKKETKQIIDNYKKFITNEVKKGI